MRRFTKLAYFAATMGLLCLRKLLKLAFFASDPPACTDSQSWPSLPRNLGLPACAESTSWLTLLLKWSLICLRIFVKLAFFASELGPFYEAGFPCFREVLRQASVLKSATPNCLTFDFPQKSTHQNYAHKTNWASLV